MNASSALAPELAGRLATVAAPVEHAAEERWRQWQVVNAESSRKSAVYARRAFTLTFIAITGWLGLLLWAQSGI